MASKSNPVKQIITQFILIVFSVVLGLYLSERIEDGKKRKESEELLTTIKSEVKDNLNLLEYWVPYHQDINENLGRLAKDEEFIAEFINNKFAIFDRLLTRGTFMSRSPASDAWEIAKSHPLVVNIDYDKWVILSRIYNQQGMTFEPAMEMMDLFESKNVNQEQDAKANLELMSNYIHELVAREKQLMDYYQSAVVILELQDEDEVENEVH